MSRVASKDYHTRQEKVDPQKKPVSGISVITSQREACGVSGTYLGTYDGGVFDKAIE